MKKVALVGLTIVLAILSMMMLHQKDGGNAREKKAGKKPSDWFMLQRAYPYDDINYQARAMAFEQALAARETVASTGRGAGWEFGGPVNIGGRISALAMHPDDMQTIYAGAASGGIFKSTNTGQTWTPVFEDAMSLSIGDIALAGSDPGVVYVGTGEANAGGGSVTYDGDGVYRSDDGGMSWVHLGLDNTGSIGRVAVHPSDPDIAYVAAMGRLFSNNPERGVFKTTDGGESWQKILFVNDSTGAIDIVLHPDDPDIVYAAMWERVRTPDRRKYGGQGSGIFRSHDGGATWSELTSGLPNNSPDVGRIGIDISLSDPDVLYAIYADDVGYFDGVFKTTNGGDTWTRTNDASLSSMYASYGWWFGRLVIDPADPDIVYGIGFDLYKTVNGGNSWSNISGPVHVDQHDLIAHPLDHGFVVLGNDGGVYLSYNAGSSWTFLDNLPITQFYTCEVDEQYPERFYGGTQDNGTNRTFAAGLGNWESIYWGDGFYVLVDPLNNNYVYAEYQYGNFARSTNGGASFTSAMNGISSSDRKNWCTPFVFDPNNPEILYYGANRLYKTTNRAMSWQAISNDLTNGPGNYNQVYGTITTISVPPSNTQVIYVGTDDGNAWVTLNGGADWTNISNGLPVRWITRVAAHPYMEEVVFLTLSGYRYDTYQPHVFMSTDHGNSWTDISGNLPEAPVNDIIVDPDLDSTLYACTDFGVFMTRDMGAFWFMLGDDLPNVPVVDLDLHQPTRKLVAATYGRSMYSFNLDQLVSVKDPLPNEYDMVLYPNPAREVVSLQSSVFSRQSSEIYIFDIGGKLVKEIANAGSNERITINVEDLLAGVYLVKLGANETTSYRKLIIQ